MVNVPLKVPFLAFFLPPHVPVYFCVIVPEIVPPSNGPLSIPPLIADAGVSVSPMPKNPIELPCRFRDHFRTIFPVATSPALVSAAHVTAFVVFTCATYWPANTPFVQPDRV